MTGPGNHRRVRTADIKSCRTHPVRLGGPAALPRRRRPASAITYSVPTDAGPWSVTVVNQAERWAVDRYGFGLCGIKSRLTVVEQRQPHTSTWGRIVAHVAAPAVPRIPPHHRVAGPPWSRQRGQGRRDPRPPSRERDPAPEQPETADRLGRALGADEVLRSQAIQPRPAHRGRRRRHRHAAAAGRPPRRTGPGPLRRRLTLVLPRTHIVQCRGHHGTFLAGHHTQRVRPETPLDL